MGNDEQRYAVCLAYVRAAYLKVYGTEAEASEADAALLTLYAQVLSAKDERH